MKWFLILVFALITVTFTNCKKEELELPPTSQDTIQTISIYGKWELKDAYMYVENLETGEKTRYSHFSSTKTTSSLRFAGALYDIEVIEKDVTTWEFTEPNIIPGYGKFILNSDTTEKYGFYVTHTNWTIVEDPSSTQTEMNLGGSSRPIRAYIDDYSLGTCKFYVQEAYENINGYNCKYFNELIFQKIN